MKSPRKFPRLSRSRTHRHRGSERQPHFHGRSAPTHSAAAQTGLSERGQLSRRHQDRPAKLSFEQIALPDVAGRHILILDDILDSGLTPGGDSRKTETAQPSERADLRASAERQSAQLRRCRRIMSASRSPTNSWSVTASITWSAIATFRASVCCGRI